MIEASSSSSSSLILDRYGNAVQLQHALNAAQKQSSLVMVLDRRPENGDIWVVSSMSNGGGGENKGTVGHLRQRRRRSDNYDDSTTTMIGQPYLGPTTFLQPILSSFSHSFTNAAVESSKIKTRQYVDADAYRLAVVCVGVQSDAKWLLSKLNRYAMVVWERTDTRIGVQALLGTMTTLFRQCAMTNYPTVPQSYGTALEMLLEQDKENKSSRPLGICALVLNLECTTNNSDDDETRVFRIDPSGMVKPMDSPQRFCCLGKHSTEMETWWQTTPSTATTYKEKNPVEYPVVEGGAATTTTMQELELCQRFKQGLSHVLGGPEMLPDSLRIEIWNNQRKTIHRRIVSLQDL